MIKQYCVSFAPGGLAVLLVGCGAGNEQKDNTPPPAKVDDSAKAGSQPKDNTPLSAKVDDSAKAEIREVWLQVDGMSERLKIL